MTWPEKVRVPVLFNLIRRKLKPPEPLDATLPLCVCLHVVASVGISHALSHAPFPVRHVSALLVGDMSVEELLEKYKGAYASDFELPSASGSKASSDSEVSGDEEEETEEDESDAESNTSSSGRNPLPRNPNQLMLSC